MHSIALFVAAKPICTQLAEEISHSRVVRLSEEFSGLALFAPNHESIFTAEVSTEDVAYVEFQCLSVESSNAALRLSTLGKIAYVETEYFGGDGSQAAVVWEAGKVAYGPSVWHEGTINSALRLLGVSANLGQDEFLTIGFGMVRKNEDFFRNHRE